MTMPVDKKLHYFVGFFIGAVFTLLTTWILPSLLIVAAAGAGKEVYDKRSGKGNPEWWDFIYTVFGGLTWLVILYLSRMIHL